VAQNPLVEMLEGIKRRYRRRFPDVVDVMAVSCKSKKGVRELQQRIVEAAEKKRYVGQEVPPTWVILSRHIIHMQTKQPPLMVPSLPSAPQNQKSLTNHFSIKRHIQNLNSMP